jgi:hypothetical protein
MNVRHSGGTTSRINATLSSSGVEGINSTNIFFEPHTEKMMKCKHLQHLLWKMTFFLLEREQGIPTCVEGHLSP